MEELTLAPDLTVAVQWSWRMNQVLWKQYPDLSSGRPCADEQLRQEYERWQQKLKACYWHIQQFFKLTGNLPIAGDLLLVLEDEQDWKHPLCIESRKLFACVKYDGVQVIYAVQGRDIEWLEGQLDEVKPEAAHV